MHINWRQIDSAVERPSCGCFGDSIRAQLQGRAKSHFLRALVALVLLAMDLACHDPARLVPDVLEIPTRHVIASNPWQPIALGVTALAGAARLPGHTIRYTSVDSSLLRVDADGIVRVLRPGRGAIIVSAGRLVDTVIVEGSFHKPVWRFTVVASIAAGTLGGIPIERAAWEFQRHLDSVNAIFNQPNVFAGYVVFTSAGVRTFNRPLTAELEEAATDADYKVVYHSDHSYNYATYDDRWHVVQVGTVPGNLFVDRPFPGQLSRPETLAHELAHGRGARDLYGLLVVPQDNNLDRTMRTPPSALMNADAGGGWDPLSIYLINWNAGRRGQDPYAFSGMVDGLRVRVVTPRGEPVPGSTVTFHLPVVNRDPALGGVFMPIENCDTALDGTCHLSSPIMSVLHGLTVRAGDRRAVRWVTALELAEFAATRAGGPYPLEITVEP